MKRVLFSCFALISAASMAITPITGFTERNYLGDGDWLSQDGNTGTFKTFIDFESDGWTVAKFSLGNLYVYETTAQIDSNGFLTATVNDVSDPSNVKYYSGYGNCGSTYCQFTVALDNGVMQKAIIFNSDGTLENIGAIYFNDGTPNIQWEGSSVPLP